MTSRVPARRVGINESHALHETRLDFVLGVLLNCGSTSVVDLGCGSGALLKRLTALPQFSRIVGVELSAEALAVARREFQAGQLAEDGGRLTLINGCYLSGDLPADVRMQGFDAAVLVETIEHVDPKRLALLEVTLFSRFRPDTVVVTTPNQEYNVLFGLGPGQLRDPDHRFEWPRARFRAWGLRLARQYGYRVMFSDIGEACPELGSPSQAACFMRMEQAGKD